MTTPGPVCRPYTREDAAAFGEDYETEVAQADARATTPTR